MQCRVRASRQRAARRPGAGIARVAAGALALLCAVATARAELAAGLGAYGAGAYARALRELAPAAAAGDPVAQVVLGTMYLRGEGVAADGSVGVAWLRRAAEQGHAGAQLRLSRSLEATEGAVADRDRSRALYWLREAARGGHPDAQYHLAQRLVQDGDGESERWLRDAARRGHTGATVWLAGLPTPPPFVVARSAPPGPARRGSPEDAAPAAPAAAGRLPGASKSVHAADSAPVPRSAAAVSPPLQPLQPLQALQPMGPIGPMRPVSSPAAAPAWLVQLAAFRRPERIRRAWDGLIARHPGLLATFSPRTEQVTLSDPPGVWFRLRVGPLDSAARASAVCRQLAGTGGDDCFVVRRSRAGR